MNGEAIAECKRKRHCQRLERAGQRETANSSAALVHSSSQPDAEKGDGQNEPEREGRTAEERCEHAIPDELHQEESKTDDGSGAIDLCRARLRRAEFRSGFRHGAAVPYSDDSRNRADRHVQQHGGEQRVPIPQSLQHEECRQKGAGHGAEGIDAVEQRDATTAGIVGIPMTSVARMSRRTVARKDPRVTEPPTPK